MNRYSAIASIFITLTSAQIGLAQVDRDSKAAESLVRAFIGGCVQIMPNLEKVEALARIQSWRQMTGDTAKVMAPQNAKAVWKSWLATDVADVPFIISISTGVEGKNKISVCNIANPYAPPQPIQGALVSMLKLHEKIDEQAQAGQRTTSWKSSVNGRSVLISMIDATPTNDPGINISVAMFE
jgi:hypothetical protein